MYSVQNDFKPNILIRVVGTVGRLPFKSILEFSGSVGLTQEHKDNRSREGMLDMLMTTQTERERGVGFRKKRPRA